MERYVLSVLLVVLASQAWALKVVEETKLPVKEHPWSCKNGNLLRTGTSEKLAGPSDITARRWFFLKPGHTCWTPSGKVEVTPLIDRDSNTYIETSLGEIHKLSSHGELLWTAREPGARILQGALDGDSLYAGTTTGVALSVDLATGKINWRKKYSNMAGTDPSTTTVANGTAIFAGVDKEVSSDGGNKDIVALSTADGSEKWRFTSPGVFYNFMPVVSDDNVVFIDFNGRMYSLSLSSGKLQWQSEGLPTEHVTSGVVKGPNDLVYANFNTDGGAGGVIAFDLKTGKEQWRKNVGISSFETPAVGPVGPNGEVGVLVGIGSQLKEAFNYALTDTQARLLALDAQTGQYMWSFTPPARPPASKGVFGVNTRSAKHGVPDTWSTPAIGKDGTVYIGWQGATQFAIKAGAMLSSFEDGFGTQGEPAIGDGFVVFATCGEVAAF